MCEGQQRYQERAHGETQPHRLHPAEDRSEMGKQRPVPPQNGEPEVKTKRRRQCDGGRKAKIYDFTAFLKENIGTSGTEAVKHSQRQNLPKMGCPSKGWLSQEIHFKRPTSLSKDIPVKNFLHERMKRKIYKHWGKSGGHPTVPELWAAPDNCRAQWEDPLNPGSPAVS